MVGMDAYNILVLILGAVLLIFLMLGIVATILVIKILNHAKMAMEQAAKMAESAVKAGEFFKQASTPVGLGKLIMSIVRKHTKEG